MCLKAVPANVESNKSILIIFLHLHYIYQLFYNCKRVCGRSRQIVVETDAGGQKVWTGEGM